MGWIARALGLGKTYEELSPMEKEWVDHCGFQFFSTGGTVYYDEKTLAQCREDCEVNTMFMDAIQRGLGLPPITTSADEMRKWVQAREREIEMEKAKRRLEKHENQRRPAIRDSGHRPKKSRVVRSKSKLRHRDNGKVSYS